MSVDFLSIGASAGFGGAAGFLVGFAIKKMVKLFLIVLGIFLGILLYLQYLGIISINWKKLEATFMGATMTFQSIAGQITGIGDSASAIMTNIGIPLSGSLAAGFVVGFIKG